VNELLARATQGVDLTAPGAFWHVFANLLAMMPWAALFWWNVFFIVVGALLGWWRGRLAEGIAWAFVLGPLGWLVFLLRKRSPPPLPP